MGDEMGRQMKLSKLDNAVTCAQDLRSTQILRVKLVELFEKYPETQIKLTIQLISREGPGSVSVTPFPYQNQVVADLVLGILDEKEKNFKNTLNLFGIEIEE